MALEIRIRFPFFRWWVKIVATDDLFASALEARRTVCDFMAMQATNFLAAPRFLVERLLPLEKVELFEAAIDAGHGKYIYSADNEVLVFGEEFMTECAESIPFG